MIFQHQSRINNVGPTPDVFKRVRNFSTNPLRSIGHRSNLSVVYVAVVSITEARGASAIKPQPRSPIMVSKSTRVASFDAEAITTHE